MEAFMTTKGADFISRQQYAVSVRLSATFVLTVLVVSSMIHAGWQES